MTRYIENLRNKLEESTNDIQSFIENVTGVVVLNAGIVQETYENTGLAIDDTLMEPWRRAAAEIEKFGGAEGALALMNSWTESKEGAPFYDFENAATKYLRSPWTTAKRFATLFSKTVSNVMTKVVENIKSNVSTSLEELQKVEAEIKKINDTELRGTGGTNGGDPGGGDPGGNYETGNPSEKEKKKTKYYKYIKKGNKYYYECGSDASGTSYKGYYIQRSSRIPYGAKLTAAANEQLYDAKGNTIDPRIVIAQRNDNGKVTTYRSKYHPVIYCGVGGYVEEYAKGTTGTKKDQWAITDEIGDELILVPGKDGNLSFMRKGTGVVPADLTKRLFELAQMPTNELIDNNIIKPLITNVETKNQALSVNFEALVKAETITSDVLPEVEKMVSKQLDAFTKKLNYALKRV